MKKLGSVCFLILMTAAGLLIASCKPAVTEQFGTLIIGIADREARTVGPNGLPDLNASEMTFTVTKADGSLIKEQNYRPDEPKTLTVTLPIGEIIKITVSLKNPSAEWTGMAEHTITAGTNTVNIKLQKKVAALHTFLFSRGAANSADNSVSFSLQLNGHAHRLPNLKINAETHPSFVRDSKRGIYLVYAEYVSASQPKEWKMVFYDSEGKNPKPITLPSVPRVRTFVPALDFTTGKVYVTAVPSVSSGEGTLYRLDEGRFIPASFKCTEKYAVDNNRLVRIRTEKGTVADTLTYHLEVFSGIDQAFEHSAAQISVSARKNITNDIRIENIKQPDIEDICIHGDAVYILFSASESYVDGLVKGGFYCAGGLVRYPLTQTEGGVQLGEAETFGFDRNPLVKERSFPRLAGSKVKLLENADYENRFYSPVRFIGFDQENLYIADDGIAFRVTAETQATLTQQAVDRIAAFTIKTGTLSFDSAPAGTVWLAGADASGPVLPAYVKVPYTDLAEYLRDTASDTEINNIEITGDIPKDDFSSSSQAGNLLGKKIKAASPKKIALKLPRTVSGLTDMSGCFLGCDNLVSLANIPEGVNNMAECFAFCTGLTEAPAIPEGLTNMSSCFDTCRNLTKAPPAIPASVTQMQECFSDCEKLIQAPVLPPHLQATDMTFSFRRCKSLTQGPIIPERVTNMMQCFEDCEKLEAVILNCPYTPALPGGAASPFKDVFKNCTALKAGGIRVRSKHYGLYTTVAALTDMAIPGIDDAGKRAKFITDGYPAGTIVLKNNRFILPTESYTAIDTDNPPVAVLIGVQNAQGKHLGIGLHTKSGLSWAKAGSIGDNTKFAGLISTPSVYSSSGAAERATFTGDTVGIDNWEYICKIDSEGTKDAETNYPAFHWVNEYGKTYKTGEQKWYLPSISELCEVYKNREAINVSLAVIHGLDNKAAMSRLDGERYWSSSQHDSITSRVWFVDFYDFLNGNNANDGYQDDGDVGYDYKSSGIGVCCFAGF